MEHDQHKCENKAGGCPPPSKRPAAQLRKAGLIVLLAGFSIAGMIYAFVPEKPSSEENPSLTEYHDKEDVAVQRMWGREGSLTLELTRSLKRASTYTVLVIVVSVLGSFMCFYLVRDTYDEKDAQPTEATKKPVSGDPAKSEHDG